MQDIYMRAFPWIREKAEGGMLVVGFELDIAEFIYASFI